jgi:hypothetical protein
MLLSAHSPLRDLSVLRGDHAGRISNSPVDPNAALRHQSPRSFRRERGFPSASLRLGVSALNSRSDPTQRRGGAEARRGGWRAKARLADSQHGVGRGGSPRPHPAFQTSGRGVGIPRLLASIVDLIGHEPAKSVILPNGMGLASYFTRVKNQSKHLPRPLSRHGIVDPQPFVVVRPRSANTLNVRPLAA